MDHWQLPSQPAAAVASPLQRSLLGAVGVVRAIGSRAFAAEALVELHSAVGAGSWAVYERFVDRPPVLHLSASHGMPDTTLACFAVYRDGGLYQRDDTMQSVRAPAGQTVLMRMQADEAPNADHRDAIYRRHGLVERLSVATRRPDGSVLATNLYRHTHQGRFGAGDTAHFADLAPLLLAGVERHLALQAGAGAPPIRAPQALTRDGARAALRARCPALTQRELDVLERLLQGLSYDGIAADLRLSLATVKTYRARAFGRLGLHFKSELFAAFGPAGRWGHPLG